VKNLEADPIFKANTHRMPAKRETFSAHMHEDRRLVGLRACPADVCTDCRKELQLARLWERLAVSVDFPAGVLNPTELEQAQHEPF
jgi:hypothetical protein